MDSRKSSAAASPICKLFINLARALPRSIFCGATFPAASKKKAANGLQQ
jgi:hypothetical protein